MIFFVSRELFSCGLERTLSCCMRDLVHQPGTEPGPPALEMQSLSHWATREVPIKLTMIEAEVRRILLISILKLLSLKLKHNCSN